MDYWCVTTFVASDCLAALSIAFSMLETDCGGCPVRVYSCKIIALYCGIRSGFALKKLVFTYGAGWAMLNTKLFSFETRIVRGLSLLGA